jgi:shikimate kinase|tara:strand:- start:2821 stop:3336 length:516 start_codon:yes stop_codon:yes gene_type:complete
MSDLKNRIFLIGPMGSGKTTVGRRLASMLGKTFCDTDNEVEAKTGVNIAYIFDVEGEEGFRTRESAALFEKAQLDNIIISTGGGIIELKANREVLKNGYVVYLKTSLETQKERATPNENRPLLLNTNAEKQLTELMIKRKPLYEESADRVIITDGLTSKAVAKQIFEAINE